MATIIGKTSEKIDELLDDNIVSGEIDENGNLILTTRGGAQFSAGTVVKPFGATWSSVTDYTVGDVVGYAGTLWKATADNTDKPPALYTSLWTRLHGFGLADWAARDAYFSGNNLAESWDTSIKTGAPTTTLTTTVGEYETSGRALKVSLSSGQIQNILQTDENILSNGEYVIVEVRAKLNAASSGTTVNAELLVNSGSAPTPGASGLVTKTSAGAQALTTAFGTYTFVILNDSSTKSRANINVKISAPTNAAVVCIDHIRVYKGKLARNSLIETPDAGSADKQVVNAEFVQRFIRGAVLPFAGATAPDGTLMCDGSAVSRTTYAALFAVIGTTYGTGNGSTTFNVPDLRHRFPLGANGDLGSSEGLSVGSRAARLTHAHTHGPGTLQTGAPTGDIYDNNSVGGAASRTGPFHTHDVTSGATASGGSSEHPRLNLNYIIVC